ncbi:Cytochrome p450 [Thalictrum thalictroides]|uniref:Cytochrome p450 n=1 Tax=Thalictrum thalictroides TaxID=46969 RepID=A0A7J6V6A9_THATH|nr:Cytochrome p450 [Thalictrum thalictroides]
MVLELLFYTIIFVLSAILGREFWYPRTQKRLTRLPPSPKELPIIGHLHLLNNTPHQTFHNLCTRYGPLIHLRLGSVLCIIASTPEHAKELLITNGLAFASRPNIRCSGEDEQAKEIRSLVRDSTDILAQFNLSDFIGFLRDIDLQGIRKRAKNIHLRYDALLETITKKHKEDFLTAGTDTSGIVVEWTMLVKESDIQDLPYLRTVFKETLRLHPPIPIFERESTEDCNIEGYDIPAKKNLFINNSSICRDPKNWKNPLEFQPERFMSCSEGDDNLNLVDVRGQHFNLLPFGTGRRGCPGVSLAVHLVPMIMALLIQCFDWKLTCDDNGVIPKLVDMTERSGLTIPKAHPLMVVPSARLNPFPISVEL